MGFKTISLILGLLASTQARSVDQATNNTLQFLGKSGGTKFYKSPQNANYIAARKDCEANHMQLAAFETAEQLEDVRTFLLDHDDASTTFWVGGVADGDVIDCRNNLAHECFIWEETETPLGPHIVWSRQTNSLYNDNSKMYLISRKRRTPVFDFDDNTNNYRYICEEPAPPCI